MNVKHSLAVPLAACLGLGGGIGCASDDEGSADAATDAKADATGAETDTPVDPPARDASDATAFDTAGTGDSAGTGDTTLPADGPARDASDAALSDSAGAGDRDGPASSDGVTVDASGSTDASAGDGVGASDADAVTDAPCTLANSGPVVVNRNGQVVENLRITATATAAITVDGYANVVIRNVTISHTGGPGISFSDADDLRVENVSIVHTGAPASGANDSDDRNNIDGYASARPQISNVRLTRGSAGIYLVSCPGSQLRNVEGHDFRGPFPRGQLAQWNNSNDGLLDGFSVVNPAGSWPEDNVNIYQSTNVTVRNGHIDGNNSPSGVGVIFDGGNSTGLVEDVDAIHMGNGCFSAYDGADGSIFRRTRCRDNICTSQGRGVPLSGALMWCGREGLSNLRIEASTYFSACAPNNTVWPEDSFALIELAQADFVPRAPLALTFCWE